MRSIWLMAITTYRRRIRSGTFLVLTFALPSVMVIAAAIPILQETSKQPLPTIGYVDGTGQLPVPEQIARDGTVLHVITYNTSEAARAAANGGRISGYLVVPADYFAGGRVAFYGEQQPATPLDDAMQNLLRRALLPNAPDWELARLASPTDMTFVALESGTEATQGPAVLVHILTPIVLAMVFALAVFTGVGQIGSAVVREKEQRAMEIVITSLSPTALVAGKVAGMSLLTLTQIGIWVVGAAIAVLLATFGDTEIPALSIPWQPIVWAILLGLPGYFLYAIIAAGLGIIAGDTQQAQQLAGFLGILALAPLWFLAFILLAPNGPLSVALTLFPFTAPLVALFRMALTNVPLWQFLASFSIIVASLLVSIWLVTRIFRAAMLLYGQSMRPRQILEALRQA